MRHVLISTPSFEPHDPPMSESGPDSEPRHEEVSDHSLGGYLAVHNRPPAYEGTDGHPYTVSIEIQQTGNLRSPLIRTGRTVIVGFHPEVFAEVFGGLP